MPLSRRAPQDLNFPLIDADALLNLRAFIKNCILPNLYRSNYDGPFYNTRIDPQNCPNSLQIRPESWRLLELIYSIPSQWTSLSLAWLDSHIPRTPVNSFATHIGHRIDARLTLRTEIPELYADKPGKISSQIAWVDLALVTATQVLHHSVPALREWAFVERRRGRGIDFDENIFAEFLWCRAQRDPRDNGNECKTTLIVAIQPHWVLEEPDIEQFVDCRAIWDACVQSKAHRFVLTNYKQWVFGGFSKSYKVGFVSPIYKHDSSSPTIVELLAYWIASSARLPGTCNLPKVLEPVIYSTVEIGRPSNALGCKVKSDVAWGQIDREVGLLQEVDSLEELDTESQWSDEGSMVSGFEPHDTDRHEIVEGWVNDQARDGRQGTYPYPVIKRSFPFVEPTLEEACGDWLI
ncbi:hypothetical protein BYT27DRAFT_7265133 [Phlegmacium glaucopus]|nr:hypothetical protein BYT27DRAFT_7265133 [Phlegmacium glaucopus]